jgi:Pyridoxamine 5'-phosphate oxidase
MLETAEELADLQALLDASHARSGDHLKSIIEAGERTPTAAQVAAHLTGMRLLVVATVDGQGRPMTSAVDGHFVHARWVFTTSATAVKAAHLRARPAISASHVEGETFAMFTHGEAEFLDVGNPIRDDLDAYLTAHYGSSPSSWAPDIDFLWIRPRWSVAYAPDAAALPTS